jgi:hypothetical protein
MKSVLVAVLVLAGQSCPSVATGASEYDGRYTGLINCDVLPGQTVEQLKTEFSLKIIGSQAEYQREVLRPTDRGRLGVTERGTGTVSPDGEVSLTGSAAGQTWSYEAKYSGRFEGKNLRLTGAQMWRLSQRPTLTRRCTIGVSRSD